MTSERAVCESFHQRSLTCNTAPGKVVDALVYIVKNCAEKAGALCEHMRSFNQSYAIYSDIQRTGTH